MKGILTCEDALCLWENKSFLAKGKRGIVYTAVLNGKTFLLKSKSCGSHAGGTVSNEAKFNVKLNSIGVGPKFFFYDTEKDFLVREFVDGVPIVKWAEATLRMDGGKEKVLGIILDVLGQCRKMDLAGVNKFELTNPYKDILVDKHGRLFIIDFERCRFSDKPKNVTQFCQFLYKGKMGGLLSRSNVSVKEKILGLANDYKKSYGNKEFNKIISYVKSVF